jgi:uroporphyrinogen-III synthase
MPSDPPPQLLLTGPVGQMEVWSAAVLAAGWQPVQWPLLAFRTVHFAWPFPPPDWLIVTSAQALPALTPHRPRLLGLPFAAVGRRSALALQELGAIPSCPPADSAEQMIAALKGLVKPGQRAIWPHGPRSTELIDQLAALGLTAVAPLAYADAGPSPGLHPLRTPADATTAFLASPSALERLLEHAPPTSGWTLIAIGPTTNAACQRARHSGAPLNGILSLPQPRPEFLTQLLRAWPS